MKRLLRKQGCRGFTLIEMLVVVAIIALLVSILVPVVGAAMDRSRAVKGVNHARQIGVYLLDYSLEEKGRLPRHGSSQGMFYTWTEELAEGMGLEADDFVPGQRPPGILAAPGSKWVLPGDIRLDQFKAFSDFAPNLTLLQPGGGLDYGLMSLIRTPSRVAFVMTSGTDENAAREVGPWMNNDREGSNRIVRGMRVLYSKGTRGAVVYVDGHAELADPETFSASSNDYPWRDP